MSEPSSDALSDRAPFYGGQAVVEGVMMRGVNLWAVAVRRPSGEIHVERHPVSDFPQRHPAFRKPLLRGMFALVDALAIGTRALAISANQSVEDSEQLTPRQMGGNLAFALLLFVVIFIVAPNAGLAFASRAIGDGLLYHLVEGVVRVAIFLGYLALISLASDIRRVFAYHGAEHMTIAAWEHREVLAPERIRRYSTLHVRCGTNFLLLVMLIAILTYSLAGALVPPPPGAGVATTFAYHVALRILLLPVVAGLAYEGLRLGAGRDNALVGALMRPGLWLQKITTRPPDDDQIEVAIRAFEAVVPRKDLAGRVVPLPSPVVHGPSDVSGRDYGRDEAADADPTASGLSDVTGEPVTGGADFQHG